MTKTLDPFDSGESITFIVNSFSDMGADIETEVLGLNNAIELLRQKQSMYDEHGCSFSSLMSEPYLAHPDGSGLLWSLDNEDWE